MYERFKSPSAALASIGGRRMLWILAIVGLPAGCKPDTAAVAPPSAVPVTIAAPIEREVQDYEEATGRVAAQYSIEVRSRVTGYLDRIDFVDGAEVKAGDPLFVIDPRPFKAAYDAAVAQIELNKANLAYRQAELNRNKELLKTQAVSQSEFDKSAASFEQAKALIAASEADAESAKLNLGFTDIRAAIDGRTSSRNIDKGNLVLADQTLLTTIVSVDPMYVKFDLDERRLLRIQQQVREGKIALARESQIPVEMALDNEDGFPHRGTIDFADNQVDQNTGTIEMRGVFSNPLPPQGKRVLIPGLFARIRVPLGKPRKAALVAEQCLGSDQGQRFVYVVDAKKEVQYRRVKVGKADGGLRVIEDGLQPGEHVIVAGLQRVRPGASVEPKVVDMASFGTPEPESPRPDAEPAATATTSDVKQTPEKK